MTKPGDSQTKKTIHELAKEFPNKTYKELEKYRDADRQEEALGIGAADHNHPPDLVEVMAIENDKLKKRAQEAEGELSILRGIETNRVKEAQAKSSRLQDEMDRVKKENNDLYNKIADLTESLKSKDYFEKPDYKFLVDENHRLEQQYLEVMADNKKLAQQVEDKLDQLRKAGL